MIQGGGGSWYNPKLEERCAGGGSSYNPKLDERCAGGAAGTNPNLTSLLSLMQSGSVDKLEFFDQGHTVVARGSDQREVLRLTLHGGVHKDLRACAHERGIQSAWHFGKKCDPMAAGAPATTDTWHHSATPSAQVGSTSPAGKEEEAVAVGTALSAPGADAFVTVQLFQDGMRAGLEGMAKTTAAHLGKLEQRTAALEERVKINHCTQPPDR